jgi:hypothetical protein
MPLTRLAVDQGAHNSDGLLLRGCDGPLPVTAFISRRPSWLTGWTFDGLMASACASIARRHGRHGFLISRLSVELEGVFRR